VNPVVKTFLLVSAAYLFGSPALAMPNRGDRAATNQGRDDCVVEECTAEAYSRLGLLPDLAPPVLSEDARR
jgi:hypothetical protein